jgi:hypothetical protein
MECGHWHRRVDIILLGKAWEYDTQSIQGFGQLQCALLDMGKKFRTKGDCVLHKENWRSMSPL